MSNSLAIAAVTSSLRRLLIEELAADPLISGFSVSTKALAKAAVDSGDRINLFLYEVVPSPHLRNLDMPSGGGRPGERGQPPLSLGLRYLVTAFGDDDDEIAAHKVLGRTLAAFHDKPVLPPTLIRDALAEANLHRQVEDVRLTPVPMSVDEMSKLWTTFEAGYRASAAYEASVVLIESERPTIAGLPVLTVGVGDRGVDVVPEPTPPRLGPLLERAVPPDDEATVELGEMLALEGAGLEGASAVRVVAAAGATEYELAPLSGSGPGRILVRIPADGTTGGVRWRAGIHTARAVIAAGGGADVQTNSVAFALGPRIDSIDPGTATPGDVTYTVAASPRVALEQRASLLLGEREVLAEARGAETDPLTFEASDLTSGTYAVRLRVDGVDSRLIDRSTTPPSYRSGTSVEVS